MNLSIKINTKNIREIIWPIYFLTVIKLLARTKIGNEELFLIYCAIVVFLAVYSKKIRIPRIAGMNPYLFFIFYSSIIGFFLYPTRNVVRDMFYFLPTVIVMIMGYYLYLYYGKSKSLVKTLELSGLTYSTYVILRALVKAGELVDVESIRRAFDIMEYEIAITFIVVFYYIVVKKQRMLCRIIDWYAIAVMGSHLILSLERSIWIGVGIGCGCLYVITGIHKKNLLKTASRGAIIATMFVGVVVVTFSALPEEVSNVLADKFTSTTDEISSAQTFKTSGDAQQNWRGYEMFCAKKEWKSSPSLIAFFGAGMGKGVKIRFIPEGFKSYVEDFQIPLLHCAYYTILPKGGLFGIGTFIWLFLANIYAAIKAYRRNIIFEGESITLIAIMLVFMIQSYVVRGPVGQVVTLSWATYIGWVNASFRRKLQPRQQEQS